MGKTVAIHASADIPWHDIRASYLVAGFRHIGIPCRITRARYRDGEDIPILLGTTLWRSVENDGGEYILVDRCAFGDTNKFVSLVWNGHGRRGDHRAPDNPDPSRWEKYGVPIKPWKRSGKRVVLCGQVESYCKEWPEIEAWYNRVRHAATHFRPHPAGYNPTALPTVTDWRDVRLAVTLNSSIGVQAVLDGIPTVTCDAGSMAWDVTSHDLESPPVTPERMPWAHWLAWCQWTDDELREGVPWEYLL